MRFLNHTLIFLCLAFIIGIYVGFYNLLSIKLSLAIVAASALVLVITKFLIRLKALVFLVALFLFFNVGCFNSLLHLPENDEKHVMHLDVEAENLQDIKAEVVEVLKANAYNYKYLLGHLRIDSRPYNGKVLLHVNKTDSTKILHVGDRLQLFSKLRMIEPPKNPQLFNYAEYLKTKDVYAQVYENQYLVTHHNTKSLAALGANLRARIVVNLEQSGLKPHHLQLVQALILGQKQNIDQDMYSQFADVGIVHILAVSGLHVGLLFLMFSHLFKPLLAVKHGIKLRVLLIVLLLWGFAFMVGFSASVVRAVTMFSCFAVSDVYQRRTNSINVLLLSALILLLFNPNMLFEVGFQLSYAAVFSIVCLYPVFSKWYYPKHKFTKLFTDTVFVSLAAQIGVLPFQLVYFHQFPTLFLLGNIIVVPFLGVLVSGGLICIVLSAINGLWYPLLWLYSVFLDGLIGYVDWLSNFKSLVFKDIYFTSPMAVALVVAILVFIVMLRRYKSTGILVFLVAGGVFASSIVIEILRAKKTTEVVIFHRYKASLIGIKDKAKLHVFTTDTALKANAYAIQNYKLMHAIDTVEIYPFQNELFFGPKRLTIIDSTGVYRNTAKERLVLLSHSPDIHFEKLIKSQNISQIIADGSNYKSYVERWERTARHYGIPFHSTYSQGYYAVKSD